MKTSWLKQHIGEIIALSFFAFAFFMFKIILLREVKADNSTQISIIECIKGVMFLIVGFYYGSSSGSKDKQEKLNELKKEDTKA